MWYATTWMACNAGVDTHREQPGQPERRQTRHMQAGLDVDRYMTCLQQTLGDRQGRGETQHKRRRWRCAHITSPPARSAAGDTGPARRGAPPYLLPKASSDICITVSSPAIMMSALAKVNGSTDFIKYWALFTCPS